MTEADGQSEAGAAAADSGLACLATLLSIHHISADPAHLRHDLGHSKRATATDLLRLARKIEGVRAKSISTTWQKLVRLPLPAIAGANNGAYFLIGRLNGDEIIVQHPNAGKIHRISRQDFEDLWSGELILLTTRARTGERFGRFGFSWFVPKIIKYKSLLSEVLIITFLINILGLFTPLFFQNIVDKVISNNTLTTLNVLVFGLVVSSTWEVIFSWIRSRLYTETTAKIDTELGVALFRHLLKLPLSFFETRRVGDIITRVRELETVREFLTNSSLTLIVEPLFVFIFLAAMWLYSETLFLVVLASIPIYIIISIAISGSLRRRLNEKFERSAHNNALLVESVSGIHTLKGAAVEPQWQNNWEKHLAAYVVASLRATQLSNTGKQLVQLTNKLSMAAVLYLGTKAVIDNEMTVGALIAFNMFMQRVSGPVLQMAQLWQDFQQVRIAIHRLGDVLNIHGETGGTSQASLPKIKGDITIEEVFFRYSAEEANTLEDINLTIAAGEVIGICGPSGSGKSTLTKLIQRFHTPQSGRVFIDGMDIAQINPVQLRRQIGVVLQENVLFNRSIRANIALANPAMPLERIMQAAKLAGAHEFILRLPQGYDTIIGERGTNLSGGQRQRLAIARALVSQPRILIFDEATSALDAESEEIVQQNMRAMAQGRTVLIIAHRLSAIRSCDRILTLAGC